MNEPKYRISIIGTGYVGLCTAVAVASKGYKVVASTHNPKKVNLINRGIPPFTEPNPKEMHSRHGMGRIQKN